MNTYHILLADPNPVVRKLLAVILDGSRYRLSFASNGEEALGIALVDPPDLVISEVRLERLDGIALCQQLKQQPRGNRTKVLILTTSTSEWDMRRARRAGAEWYMTKPFSPAVLMRHVEEAAEEKETGKSEVQGTLVDLQTS
ncbi:MAG: response regulator [Sphingomonadaceae bacterium]